MINDKAQRCKGTKALSEASQLPLDYPTPDRPHRVHVALTNHCNRGCPWCGTCSSPRGNTWLDLETFAARLPPEGIFQIQLEGGEPTLHPRFWDFVDLAQRHPCCHRLIVCTNGAVLPRACGELRAWLERLGGRCTIKLSINHHLLDRDPELIGLAVRLRELCGELDHDRLVVINVRRRRGYADDDQAVVDTVGDAGLMDQANVFFLKRYGFAANEPTFDAPRPSVDVPFTMVNPDGRVFGPDLIARSEAMRGLP